MVILAEARQAEVSAETLKVYSKALDLFQVVDIEVAVANLALRERRDGETAFPSLGTLVTGVKEARERRAERDKAERRNAELKHFRDNPELYTTLGDVTAAYKQMVADRKAIRADFLTAKAEQEDGLHFIVVDAGGEYGWKTISSRFTEEYLAWRDAAEKCLAAEVSE